MRYRQCKLRREQNNPVSIQYQVTFLPERYAEVGNLLLLKDRAGKWTAGWEVLSTYDNFMEKEDYDENVCDGRGTF